MINEMNYLDNLPQPVLEKIESDLMALVKMGVPKTKSDKEGFEKTQTTIMKELKLNNQGTIQLFEKFPDCEKEYKRMRTKTPQATNTLENFLKNYIDDTNS